MAELSEWAAQALRYQGSDGPVKVMYFQSRLAVTNDSFDQNSAGPKERPESVGEQISFKVSEASDTQAVFSGNLFGYPVEVLDSKNYKLQREEWFEDRKSALEGLRSKFYNFPRVVPFDKGQSYGLEFSYIKLSKEEDLLWSHFKAHAENAKDNEEVQANRQREGRRGEELFEFVKRLKPESHPKPKNAPQPTSAKGGKEEKKEIQEKKGNKKEIEKMEKKKILEKRKELDGMTLRDGRRGFRCQCACIFGITTKFNPSGMWIVEDIFYDEGE